MKIGRYWAYKKSENPSLSGIYRVLFFLFPFSLLFLFSFADDKGLENLPSQEKRDMILVPEGDFQMGFSQMDIKELVKNGGREEWFVNAQPRQKAFTQAFYIDRYQVTNRQYAQFDPKHKYPISRADFPVTGINWHDAKEYANWAGLRLPTETEWEKAARGIMGRLFPWGDNIALINSCHSGIGFSNLPSIVPVMAFPLDRSPYGMIGASGNVAEWTCSEYAPYPGNNHKSRNYNKGLMVIRGGSYIWPQVDGATGVRRGADKDLAEGYIGFRCVISKADYVEKYGK